MFLGVLVKTENMTVSVTPDHLQKFITDGHSYQLTKSDSCADLQSLRGVMSFATACVMGTAHTLSLIIMLRWHSLSQIHLFMEFKMLSLSTGV